MPIQENSGVLPSESAAKTAKPSATSVKEALAAAKRNLSDTPQPTAEMTKDEALAIAWTGLEALAQMKQANLFRSPKTGRVVIELLATEYTPTKGLRSVGNA